MSSALGKLGHDHIRSGHRHGRAWTMSLLSSALDVFETKNVPSYLTYLWLLFLKKE